MNFFFLNKWDRRRIFLNIYNFFKLKNISHKWKRISGRKNDHREGIRSAKFRRLSFVIFGSRSRLILFCLTAVSALPPRYSRRLGLRISGPDEQTATRHAEVVARALPQDGIGNNS